ncbi:MAG: hypothetical protein HUJ72_05340 [Blautia sp.]|nr:hypothetical protein [Blautia sp.]
MEKRKKIRVCMIIFGIISLVTTGFIVMRYLNSANGLQLGFDILLLLICALSYCNLMNACYNDKSEGRIEWNDQENVK